MSKHSVHSPPFYWRGGGGVEPPTKFSQRLARGGGREGVLTGSHFLERGCWEREG